MFAFIENLNLLRYLIVVRPTHTLVTLPPAFTAEISAVWGGVIAEMLPTRSAREWRKTRELWDAQYAQAKPADDPFSLAAVPPAPWPIEAVLLLYSPPRSYGAGEPVVWELKLFGAAADHGLFLEQLLPALELAATRPQHSALKNFWGQLQIDAIYAAHGPRWRPLVLNGKLDLRRRRPTPTQWAEDWAFSSEAIRAPRRLTWRTPFDLGVTPSRPTARPRQGKIPARDVPTVEGLLHALAARMAYLLQSKPDTPEAIWALLPAEEQNQVWESCNQLRAQSQNIRHSLKPVAAGEHGSWRGAQAFPVPIPANLIPYLELASILHVGHHTHFGCGTFQLS